MSKDHGGADWLPDLRVASGLLSAAAAAATLPAPLGSRALAGAARPVGRAPQRKRASTASAVSERKGELLCILAPPTAYLRPAGRHLFRPARAGSGKLACYALLSVFGLPLFLLRSAVAALSTGRMRASNSRRMPARTSNCRP